MTALLGAYVDRDARRALVRAIATRHGAKVRILEQKTGFAIEVAWPKFTLPEPGEGQ